MSERFDIRPIYSFDTGGAIRLDLAPLGVGEAREDASNASGPDTRLSALSPSGLAPLLLAAISTQGLARLGRLDTIQFTLDDESMALAPTLLTACAAISFGASSVAFEVRTAVRPTAAPALVALLVQLRARGAQLRLAGFGASAAEDAWLEIGCFDGVRLAPELCYALAHGGPRGQHAERARLAAHDRGLAVGADGPASPGALSAYASADFTNWRGDLYTPGAPPPRAIQMVRRDETITEGALPAGALRIEPILLSAPISEALAFFSEPEAPITRPVIDPDGAPVGLLHEKDLRRFIYSAVGLSLLSNESFGYKVKTFMRPATVAPVDWSAARLSETLTSERASNVILTRGGRYAGYLTAGALIQLMAREKIDRAADENPLTGLPGNRAIDRVIDAYAADPEPTQTLVYLDFDNFKPFNDHFGFKRGDAAIMLFAGLLNDAFRARPTILAHIGGDDFFAAFTGAEPSAIARDVERLQETFALQAKRFYSPEQRAAGRLTMMDRNGELRRFPLLCCSAAVLSAPANAAIPPPLELSRLFAEAKRAAKAAGAAHAAGGLAQATIGADREIGAITATQIGPAIESAGDDRAEPAATDPATPNAEQAEPTSGGSGQAA